MLEYNNPYCSVHKASIFHGSKGCMVTGVLVVVGTGFGVVCLGSIIITGVSFDGVGIGVLLLVFVRNELVGKSNVC